MIVSILFFLFMGYTEFTGSPTLISLSVIECGVFFPVCAMAFAFSVLPFLAIFVLLKLYFTPRYVELSEHGITFPRFFLNRSAAYIPYNEITKFYAPLLRRYPVVARHKEIYYVSYPNGLRVLNYQFMSKADFQEVIEIIKNKISERQHP